MNSNLSTIINKSGETNVKIIELLHKNDITVGALYLQKLDSDQVIIAETKTTERFYLYYNGISIFFSNFRYIK